jgi:chromate transporter
MTPASAVDLLAVFGHFLMLSLLAVGGALATAPDMHRYLVDAKGWLSDAEFTTSVALAQAAPGPNLLFVAVLGWNLAGIPGVLATMSGTLIPSTTVALLASRWAREHREARSVRAIVTGLAPLTVGLLFSTGWLLAEPFVRTLDARTLVALALLASTMTVMLRSKANPLWLIALGAGIGATGWV